MTSSEAVAPFKYSEFRSLWLAATFSNVGTFLQAVAGSWLMLELTGSATWVGLMVASNLLPTLFLAVVAGAVADLIDRTKVMIASQLLSGLAAAGMAWFTAMGDITAELLLGLGLVLGVGVAFNLPAWQSFVPDLVPRGMVASAVALNSVAFNVARAIGPALGGVILATAGAATAFGINAASYLAVVGVLIMIGRRVTVATDPDATSISAAMGVGIRFARFSPTFRRVLYLAALYAVASSVVQAVLPTLTDELGGTSTTYGLLLGAMGLGALIGAFVRPAIVRRLAGRLVSVSVTVFGIFTIALGLAPNSGWAVPALIGIGMTWVLSLTTMNATAQLMAPDWVRGRAMSLFTLAFVGVLPLGSSLSGWVADWIGAGNANIVFGIAAVCVGAITPFLSIPSLQEVQVPEYDSERILPEHATTAGGPVLVLNTWVVSQSDLAEFLALMPQLRQIRLRTGSYRWRLYRNADDPHRLTEAFVCSSWDEHLAQHRRIDDASVEVIRRARALDSGGGPRSRHLIAVDLDSADVSDPLLLAAHEEFHRTDGSVPLDGATAIEATSSTRSEEAR